ncbi:MAG: hypothetical protein HYX99_04240 [Chloroflexi bacterium]|nr:hypothetical protein [Chloroflexota bacterium]
MSRMKKWTALAGILALLLAACGPAATPTPTVPSAPGATPTPTSPAVAPTAAPTSIAPTATTAPAIKTGGTLRVLYGSDAATLDPHASRTVARNYEYAIFDTLVRHDEKLAAQPGLAESWSATNPTTLILKLRQGVKFHDGTDFSAQAAKWNLDRILAPATVSPFARSSLADLASVEVTDAYTLKLNLKRPSSALLFNLSLYHNGMMSPASVDKWGQDVGSHPVGTGAFVFESWISQTSVKLKRNPGYWEAPLPYLGGIEWKTITDPTVQLAALLTGQGDMMEVIVPDHVAQLRATPGFQVASTPGLTLTGALINHLQSPLGDLRVRQALALGLDQPAMVRLVTKGLAGPAVTMFPSVSAEFNSALPARQRDVAKAKDLLAQAGFPSGLNLEFACFPYGVTPTMAEVLQAQWKDIGVNASIRMVATGYADVLGKLTYQTACSYTPMVPLELRASTFMHSKGGYNQGRYGNHPAASRIDGLIDEIGATLDPGIRKRLFNELQQIMYDEVMDIYFFNMNESYALVDKLQGWVTYPAHEWYHTLWLK